MTKAVDRLLEEATRLTSAEQIYVANSLLNLVPEDEAEAEFIGELERRDDELESGAVIGIPVDEVFARLKSPRQ